MTSSYPHPHHPRGGAKYLLNQWMDWNQVKKDTSLGQDEDLMSWQVGENFLRANNKGTWLKVFRISPEFRILRLPFHRKAASKC